MLCSLPQSYSTLITTLEARDKSDLTLKFVKNKLINEFTHRSENRNASSSSKDAAYKVTNKSNETKKFCLYCKFQNLSF